MEVLPCEALPQRIIVAAPVMLKGAQGRLASEFPPDTAAMFEYVTFAIDDTRDSDDNVVPGIGGAIYDRLGVDDKSVYVPKLVKLRRQNLAVA
jgi:hypothetical protein